MQPGLDGAARDRLPVVLLTNSETNVPFYAVHGFEVVFESDGPSGAPRAWAMIRRP